MAAEPIAGPGRGTNPTLCTGGEPTPLSIAYCIAGDCAKPGVPGVKPADGGNAERCGHGAGCSGVAGPMNSGRGVGIGSVGADAAYADRGELAADITRCIAGELAKPGMDDAKPTPGTGPACGDKLETLGVTGLT